MCVLDVEGTGSHLSDTNTRPITVHKSSTVHNVWNGTASSIYISYGYSLMLV